MIVQRNNFTCGPTAIYNIYRQMNIKPYTLKQIIKQVKCDKDGTSDFEIVKFFRKHGYKTSIINYPTIKWLRHIYTTHKIVIGLRYVNSDGHFSTIYKFTKKGAYTTNNSIYSGNPKKIYWLSNKYLRKHIDSAIIIK